MRKNLVFGLGATGQSSSALLLKAGEKVFLKDEYLSHEMLYVKAESLLAQGAKVYEGGSVDRLILSPGIPLDNPFVKKMQEQGVEITGEIDLALSFLDNQEIIGITGTNGKTTTTLLIDHILRQAGIPSKAVGNCGYALSQYALSSTKEDVLVLELSSFQLETLYTKRLSNAVLLNITPDHLLQSSNATASQLKAGGKFYNLDRYLSMEEYAKAKFAIHRGLKKEGKLYLQYQAALDWPHLRDQEQEILFGLDERAPWHMEVKENDRAIYFEDELKLSIQSSHFPLNMADFENTLSAYLLVQPYGISEKDFLNGLASFSKPSHRMEFVACLDGVDFVDDSKATNIDAVIKAVASFSNPIVLIAGGVDKGFPYDCWISTMKGKVRKILAIGEAAPNLQRDLSKDFTVDHCANLEEAVIRAFDCSQKGDCVLLSPGCASLDMFKDYAHRGDEFQKIVMQLQKESLRG